MHFLKIALETTSKPKLEAAASTRSCHRRRSVNAGQNAVLVSDLGMTQNERKFYFCRKWKKPLLHHRQFCHKSVVGASLRSKAGLVPALLRPMIMATRDQNSRTPHLMEDLSMLRMTLAAGLVGLTAALTSTASYAATEITFWHAMGAELGKKLEEIVDGYNKSQTTYHVTPVFKGTYPEAMNGAIAAFRAHQQPDIVQVFEVGTGTMMAAKGAVYPVYQLMKDTGNEWDPSRFLSTVVGYYTDTDGNMLSFPFNSSTPIFYYNKDEFQKAGLDPNTPPKTWQEVEDFSKKLMSSGAAKCGFTSGWITWIQTENLSAWHNQPIGTKQNGFGGLDAELTLNGPVQVRHWDNLKKWSDAGFFEYGGPAGGNDAPPKFYSGECAMYMNSSGSRAAVLLNSKFNVGFGFLPYYDDVQGAPQI